MQRARDFSSAPCLFRTVAPPVRPLCRKIREQAAEVRLVEAASAVVASLLRCPRLGRAAAIVEQHRRPDQRVLLQVEVEDLADPSRLLLVDDDPPAARCDVVAEDRRAADPLALPSRGAHLVARALGDRLAFELREAEQDVEHQPARRRGRAELLRDRDEGDLVFVERFQQPGEVEQRSGKAVHLVDHDHVDPARLDVGHEPREPRPLHVRAGEAAVVVAVGDQLPARAALAFDVRLARFALCVEGVELLVEPLLRGLARVDRAAQRGGRRRLHCGASAVLPHRPPPAAAGVFFSPKKRKPFQREPVTAFAIALSER